MTASGWLLVGCVAALVCVIPDTFGVHVQPAPRYPTHVPHSGRAA